MLGEPRVDRRHTFREYRFLWRSEKAVTGVNNDLLCDDSRVEKFAMKSVAGSAQPIVIRVEGERWR